MLKIETLKSEIVKEAKIDKDLLPAVKAAKRQLQVLTDKQTHYQTQTKDLAGQIASFGKEIRNGLASGNEAEADKAIKKRNDLHEKLVVFNSLATEMEEIAIPEVQAKLADAEKRLFDALQLAVKIRGNAVGGELNVRLSEIQTDMESWASAVSSVQSELLPTSTYGTFCGREITLQNRSVRHALGLHD